MPDLAVTGGNQLRAVARSLRAAGAPGRGIRSKMRRNIVAAVKPMQAAVKENIGQIPAKGPASTGLRAAMKKATKIRVAASGATAVVRLWVNPKLMPAKQQALPAYMEGEGRKWRHPVFGDRENWVDQDSHPYFAPAVNPRIANVRAAVIAAVNETAAEIERGIP